MLFSICRSIESHFRRSVDMLLVIARSLTSPLPEWPAPRPPSVATGPCPAAGGPAPSCLDHPTDRWPDPRPGSWSHRTLPSSQIWISLPPKTTHSDLVHCKALKGLYLYKTRNPTELFHLLRSRFLCLLKQHILFLS